MYIATVELKSQSPYSQSRHHSTPKDDRELPKDYEARTWRERLHTGEDGMVFIPPMAFKNCIAECAKFFSIQIPGKGKSTYTKHFEAGIMVLEGPSLGIKKEDIEGEWLFLDSNGKKNSGSRVDRCYPKISNWKGTVIFHILDEIITKDVFIDHIDKAGKFIGIGRFRPRNGGYYGRFSVEKVNWQKA